jgi:hypothetical protein
MLEAIAILFTMLCVRVGLFTYMWKTLAQITSDLGALPLISEAGSDNPSGNTCLNVRMFHLSFGTARPSEEPTFRFVLCRRFVLMCSANVSSFCTNLNSCVPPT